MMTLKNKANVVPDFFRYTHSETGHTTEERDYDTWVARSIDYRKVNGLPIPVDFELQINDQLCQQLSPDWCQHSDPNRSWVNTRFGYREVADWLQAHLSLPFTGFVSQEEADRRAKICSGCYWNKNTIGCGPGCQKLGRLITSDLAKRKTPYDDNLKACAVCYCLNTVQPHFPIAQLLKSDTPDKQAAYAPFCWKKVGGENFSTE